MEDNDKTLKPISGTRRSSTIRVSDLGAVPLAGSAACPAPRSVRPGPASPAGPQTMPTRRDPWARRALAMGEILEDMEGRAYSVVGFLGRGGMGEVYEVEETGARRRLAVKCMRLTSIADPKTIERAKAEAVVLERLRHPNVIPVFAMGVREDGLIWMVMKLLKGHTTGQIVAELGHLPIPWALTIIRDVCFGLEAIHAFAIHRDIKPDNIYLDHDGQVVVLDIGAGKFYAHGLSTTNGYVIGTMAYMSPEQIVEPGKIDIRSDIFSTGIVLYQLLSGQHPFMREEDSLGDRRQAGASILYRPARPLREVAPWVPGYLDDVTMRAICKEREGRYENAPRFAVVLDAALRRLEHDVGPLPPLRFLSAELARRKEERAAAAAAAAAAGAADAGPGKPATSEVTKALRGELTQAEAASERPAAETAAEDADFVFAATEKVAIESLAGAMGAGRGDAQPTGKLMACEVLEGSSPQQQRTERMSLLDIGVVPRDASPVVAEPELPAEHAEPRAGAQSPEPEHEAEDVSPEPAEMARPTLREVLDLNLRPRWLWWLILVWDCLILGYGLHLWWMSSHTASVAAPQTEVPAIPAAQTSAPVPTLPASSGSPAPPPSLSATASASVAPLRPPSSARPAQAPRARPSPSATPRRRSEPPPGGRRPEF